MAQHLINIIKHELSSMENMSVTLSIILQTIAHHSMHNYFALETLYLSLNSFSSVIESFCGRMRVRKDMRVRVLVQSFPFH